jgi:hypothetical protein
MDNYQYDEIKINQTYCSDVVTKYISDKKDLLDSVLSLIVESIKIAFPTTEVWVEKDKYYDHHIINIDDEDIYYSESFSALMGELDFYHLLSNDIHNVFFAVDYNKTRSQMKSDYTCNQITLNTHEYQTVQDSTIQDDLFFNDNTKSTKLAA